MALILLIDDEEFIRTAIKFVLTAEGYKVLEARDGQEGVELFTQQPDAIDLVLSDLIMPRLNGLEMLQILKYIRPQVKQILVTGALVDTKAWYEQGIYDWLAKPFQIEQLLSKVAAALATPQRVLTVQTPNGLVHYPVAIFEPTADPGAWFVQVGSNDLLPDGAYPAVLEDSTQRTPGQYTTFNGSGGAQRPVPRGIFRSA
ncbi:MAG: response regulator [Caldilineaceae bacterium]|nr:response regulator [Caldilineaceae bacterium]